MSRTSFSNVQEIVEGVQAGAMEAKQHLYCLLEQYHYPNVSGYLINNGGHVQDVEDKFQDAVIILLQAIEQGQFRLKQISLKSHSDQLGAYLMRTVQNLWKKELRWRRRPALEVEDIYEDLSIDIFAGIVAEEFEALHEDCQVVLQRYFIQEMSTRKIGTVLHTSTQNIKARIVSCVDKLLSNLRFLNDTELSSAVWETVKRSMEDIDPKCQQLIGAFYLKGKNLSDIAKEMGYASGHSATEQKRKCIKNLNKALVQHLLKA